MICNGPCHLVRSGTGTGFAKLAIGALTKQTILVVPYFPKDEDDQKTY